MAQDEGKQEEEKFDFTREAEALGYISLDQARVLAMRTARESPGAYGRRYRNVPMAFEMVEAIETEDYYEVTLSFRPQGTFAGTQGQEQFFIEKEGNVAVRQLLSLPGRTGWRRIPLGLVAIGLVAVVIVMLIWVIPALSNGGGDGESTAFATPIPDISTAVSSVATPASDTGAPPTPVATLLTTVTPTPTPIPQPTSTLVSSSGMRRGASISGRVTDAKTGLPIANIDLAAGPKGVGDLDHLSNVRTDDNGNFTLIGLPEGIIEIHSDDTQGYINEMERTVTVGISETVTGFNYSLRQGATISGRVTDVDTGLPISGLSIRTEDDMGGTGDSFDSGRDGRYTIDGLAPGVYILTAEGEIKGYIREFYDDKNAWEDAARVAVIGTEAVEGIDFGLKRGATISGRIIDAETGLPIANMDVNAALADGDDISWDETDRDGRYILMGIPDGVVEVAVAGQGYLRTSKTVTVQDGQDVTDFDF